MAETNTVAPTTYIRLGNEEAGELEIDLISYRQKGEQVKYMSLSFSGKNPKNSEAQESSVSLDEETFYALKKFFLQLDWNS